MPDTGRDSLSKVQQLVKLASDEGTTLDERRNAALSAVKLMVDNDLTVVSTEELEAVKKSVDGMRRAMRAQKEKQTRDMILGGLIGAFVAPKMGIKLG